MKTENAGIIGTDANSELKLDATENATENADVKTDANEVAKKRTARKKENVAKFDYTYQAVSLNCTEFKIAKRLWFYKTSDKNLANHVNFDMDKLPAILESDKYKQCIFNLFCVQWNDAKQFELWTQTFPNNINSTLGSRLKFGKDNAGKSVIEKMITGAKKHYATIADGGNVKTMKQIVNPREIGANNRNGNSS